MGLKVQDFAFTSLGMHSEVKFLHHMIILYLNFWGNVIVLHIVSILSYIPTNSAKEFQFSTSLTTRYFQLSPLSNGCEATSQCGFGVNFPNDPWGSAPFLVCLVNSWISPMEKHLFKSFAHSLKTGWFYCLSCKSILCSIISHQVNDLQIFPLILCLPFCS
jgi:hypothetical protein